MPYVSKPMKLVTVWFTQDEKAFLDEPAKKENVTLYPGASERAAMALDAYLLDTACGAGVGRTDRRLRA
jgi:hypothetical protein